jgi:hypothetical protein
VEPDARIEPDRSADAVLFVEALFVAAAFPLLAPLFVLLPHAASESDNVSAIVTIRDFFILSRFPFQTFIFVFSLQESL